VADKTMDKIIEDLVKGASRNTRENGGPGVNIQVSRENRGHEEKLAFELPPAVMEALASPGVRRALPSAIGGAMGGGLQSLISGDDHPLRDIGLGAGAGAAGGLVAPHIMEAVRAGKTAALNTVYADGVKAAAAAFGIKEAFLPMIGALLGGTALRAGAGALARGVGGKALGGIASKALPMMNKGIGAAATDMVGSMGGQALGQKLMPQQQQPQQPMMN
jgi:hypothetical protein